MPKPEAIGDENFSLKSESLDFDYYRTRSDLQKLFDEHNINVEHSPENVGFIKSLYEINENIKNGKYDNQEGSLEKELSEVYNKYIKREAEYSINIPADMANLLANIEKQRPLKIADFVPALNEIQNLLKNDVMPRFVAKRVDEYGKKYTELLQEIDSHINHLKGGKNIKPLKKMVDHEIRDLGKLSSVDEFMKFRNDLEESIIKTAVQQTSHVAKNVGEILNILNSTMPNKSPEEWFKNTTSSTVLFSHNRKGHAAKTKHSHSHKPTGPTRKK